MIFVVTLRKAKITFPPYGSRQQSRFSSSCQELEQWNELNLCRSPSSDCCHCFPNPNCAFQNNPIENPGFCQQRPFPKLKLEQWQSQQPCTWRQECWSPFHELEKWFRPTDLGRSPCFSTRKSITGSAKWRANNTIGFHLSQTRHPHSKWFPSHQSFLRESGFLLRSTGYRSRPLTMQTLHKTRSKTLVHSYTSFEGCHSGQISSLSPMSRLFWWCRSRHDSFDSSCWCCRTRTPAEIQGKLQRWWPNIKDTLTKVSLTLKIWQKKKLGCIKLLISSIYIKCKKK